MLRAVVRLVVLLSYCIKATPQLLQTHIIFRHGDRAGDTLTSSAASLFYFRGPGELSNVGLSQCEGLGSDLKKRYVHNNFIDGRYIPSQVSVESSGYSRCLMCTGAAASSLFGGMAVAMRTRPLDEDYYLANNAELCSGCLYRAAAAINYTCDTKDPSQYGTCFMYAYGAHIAPQLKYFTAENASVPNQFFMANSYISEYANGLPVPSWYNQSADEEAQWIYYGFTGSEAGVFETSIRKNRLFVAGLLQQTIIDRLQCSNCTERLYMYGTHDAVVANVAVTLGVLDQFHSATTNYPPFIATLALELWKDDKTYTIKILVKDGADKHLEEVPRSACGTGASCGLNATLALMQEYATYNPSQYANEAFPNSETRQQVYTAYSMYLAALLVYTIIY